uniref:Uncharacterized protein n=1 Tax=Oryza rufipogon TaxID=4529 RepID=A0A0E0NU66_ORYRU
MTMELAAISNTSSSLSNLLCDICLPPPRGARLRHLSLASPTSRRHSATSSTVAVARSVNHREPACSIATAAPLADALSAAARFATVACALGRAWSCCIWG